MLLQYDVGGCEDGWIAMFVYHQVLCCALWLKCWILVLSGDGIFVQGMHLFSRSLFVLATLPQRFDLWSAALIVLPLKPSIGTNELSRYVTR